jgi:diguanylate cyclase (GGDEF)-like protein
MLMQKQKAAVASSHGAESIATDALMFDLAPVSLWLEDYSALKTRFDAWRDAGIADLRAYLLDDLDRARDCAALIRIIKVNRKTLTLFEAKDQILLAANLDKVFRDDMILSHVEELVQLWNGATTFSSDAVNYTLSGKRLDIQLSATILPGFETDWARVLVSIENVTDRELTRRDLIESEAYARGLFDHSPVSLWVEDFSAVKTLIDGVRACGIEDFHTFTDVHPEFVARCMSEIRVLDVNRHTIELFGARDKTDLLLRLNEVFRDNMQQAFREQLIDLWQGKLFQQREVVNYALNGEELYLKLQFSVLPGHEQDWSLVQVALTDITARKKAEAYLEFLGKHDVLTKLYNRSFFVDEINRLQRANLVMTSVIMIDLNGLKAANDGLGHAAGDEMLRRIGEILDKAVSGPSGVGTARAARIGGDEFVILMPGVDERAGQAMVDKIMTLVELNNQFYQGDTLSLAVGLATRRAGERIEDVVRRADILMYEAKRAHYASEPRSA